MLKPNTSGRSRRAARTTLGLRATASLAVLAAAPLIVAGTPTASAAACSGVEVVFARGTGQAPGIGREGQAFVDSVHSQLTGKSVTSYGVDYPASDDFVASTTAGANDASAHIQATVANCPNTKIILAGYSQGAAVIDVITSAPGPGLGFTNLMPPEIADHVAAVAVFGNPSNRIGQPLTQLSPLYGAKAIDLCNGNDPVCSGGNDMDAHSQYVQTGLIRQGASFAASHV